MNEEKRKIEQLVQEHQGYVKSLAVKFAPMPSISDDIVQQVFLEFVESSEKWDMEKDVKPLLFGFTRNVARRYWREKIKNAPSHMKELAEHIRNLAEDKSPARYTEEEKGFLRECLKKLPEKSRQLVNASYSLQLTSGDIARQMEIAANAVRGALFRIRKQLKKCIRLHFEENDYV